MGLMSCLMFAHQGLKNKKKAICELRLSVGVADLSIQLSYGSKLFQVLTSVELPWSCNKAGGWVHPQRGLI